MTQQTGRREFLQKSSTVAAATAAVSLGVHTEAAVKAEPVNVGLI